MQINEPRQQEAAPVIDHRDRRSVGLDLGEVPASHDPPIIPDVQIPVRMLHQRPPRPGERGIPRQVEDVSAMDDGHDGYLPQSRPRIPSWQQKSRPAPE